MKSALFLEDVYTKIILDMAYKDDQMVDVNLVALSPIACYELDRLQLEYTTPDDYFHPERINDYQNAKEGLYSTIFALNIMEASETLYFWANFLEKYLDKNEEVERIYYMSNGIEPAFPILINYCTSCFGEGFILL